MNIAYCQWFWSSGTNSNKFIWKTTAKRKQKIWGKKI